MADGWISGLLRQLFLVCTNFRPVEQGGGWVDGIDGRGGKGGWCFKKFKLAI